MLNKKIFPFSAISYYKKKFLFFNSNDLKNKWNILFFFPYSFTFICPTELKELKNYFVKDEKTNVYGISTDSHYTHKKWVETELLDINFPLISDFNHNISKNLKILNKDGNCERCTLIISPNLIIKYIEILDDSISRSIEETFNKLAMLKFTNKNNDKVCPHSWIKDKKFIKIIN